LGSSLLGDKQIFKEAPRVFLEDNNFIVVKTTRFNLLTRVVPGFQSLAKEEVIDPVLRVEVQLGQEVLPMNNLIATTEDLQSIVSALWNLNESGLFIDWSQSPVFPMHPSSFSSSLTLVFFKEYVRLQVSHPIQPTRSDRLIKLAAQTTSYAKHQPVFLAYAFAFICCNLKAPQQHFSRRNSSTEPSDGQKQEDQANERVDMDEFTPL
jgi:hypothetical protein